jgi:DNA polymerase
MPLQTLFIDFETYYDNEYSLKRMTTAAYVMDERFLSRGASVAIDDGEPLWLPDDKLRLFLKDIDWGNTRVVAHNTLFDGFILVHRYGYTPAEWCDTVSLLSYWFDWDNMALKNAARRLGLQDKGDALEATKGKRELSDDEQAALDEYAIGDLVICRDIFNQLHGITMPEELAAIDMTIDMMVYPRWETKPDKLEEYADRLASEKEGRLAKNFATVREALSMEQMQNLDNLGLRAFASAPAFYDILMDLNGEVPMKLVKAKVGTVNAVRKAKERARIRLSDLRAAVRALIGRIRERQAAYDARANKATKAAEADLRVIANMKRNVAKAFEAKAILFATLKAKDLKVGQLVRKPALAKTDEGLLALLEHDNDAIVAAVEARLDIMSSINETRARTLAQVGRAMGNKIPTPLRYCGAHTNRHSGKEYNLQNLPSRGDTTLRSLLVPPAGYKLVVADLSQIEPRTLGYLSQCQGYIKAFPADGSSLIYETAAAEMYSVPVDEVTKAQRQMGKISVLGQGYGMGWRKFISYAKTVAKVELTDEESKFAVNKYRATFPEIPAFWDLCDDMIPRMARYKGFSHKFNGIEFRHQAVILPSGRFLRYDNLQKRETTDLDEDGNIVSRRMQWLYGDGALHGLYGGLFVENLVQALSRDVIVDMALDVRNNVLSKQLGELIVNLVHDEIVCVVKEDRAQMVAERIKKIMSTTPRYLEGMPLSCTISIVDNYAEAK